jgi:tol-pal system protein YbgF
VSRAAALAALALLPWAGACVATKQDIRDLQLGMAANQARQDSAVQLLISRTERMLDSLSGQNVRLRGDLANRLLAIDRQLVQIQELSGQNQAQLGQLRTQIDRAAEEARRQQAAAQQAAASGASGGTADDEDAGDPQALYDAALAALRRGSVSSARAGFEEFLRTNPQHALAADAQFNIGQSYETGRDTGNAISAYGRVLELYPTSPRAPAALLKQGRLELARGSRSEARLRFNAVIARYPRSPEATEARTEIQRLGTR